MTDADVQVDGEIVPEAELKPLREQAGNGYIRGQEYQISISLDGLNSLASKHRLKLRLADLI